MTDKTIRELQTMLPWTIRYSRDFRASPQPHKDFTHALLHVGKALGKLMALADDMDHDREVADDPTLRERHAKYLADLVVCALRASNMFPGGVVDLQTAVETRITTKNAPVAVVAAEPTGGAESATPMCGRCLGSERLWDVNKQEHVLCEVCGHPTCAHCNDTHRMSLGDREVPCTRCPRPCSLCCTKHGGAYCRSAPCPCNCHKDKSP